MTTRKRRIRKKLYLDEFAVKTFSVDFALSTSNIDQILDQFTDKLEAMELCYLGVTNETQLQGHVMAAGRYDSPSEAQRAEIQHWAESHQHITKADIGPLVDN